MLLDGKRILITGVLTDASLAFSVAKLAQEEGAEIVLTSFGRQMSLTKRTARRLPTEPDIVELDVTDDSNLSGLAHVVGPTRASHGAAPGVLPTWGASKSGKIHT